MSLGLTPCNSNNYTHPFHRSSNRIHVRFATFAVTTRTASAQEGEIADFSRQSSVKKSVNAMKQHVAHLFHSRQPVPGCDPMHIFK